MKNQKEYLLAKSDGVKDCVKWLEDGMKERKSVGDGVGDLLEIKISLDKYRKKLRHQAKEVSAQATNKNIAVSTEKVKEMMDLLKQGEGERVMTMMEHILSEVETPTS